MKLNIQIKNIGFIGLGVMGMPMFENLNKCKKFKVIGFDIKKDKLRLLNKKKFIHASNLSEIYDSCDLIITCLPSGKDVDDLYFKDDILSIVKKNQLIIDMSTSHPDLMIKLEEIFKKKGIFFADAPVARTRQAAIDGTLAIMVGSKKNIYNILKPILALMGSDIMHCGPVGTGQFTKIINNMILFQNVLALSEASKIAECFDIDTEVLFKNISNCSGDSFALKNHGLKSIAKNYFPEFAFSIKYAQKDLSYALEIAKKLKVNTPGTDAVNKTFSEGLKQGFGDLYFPVIKKIL